MRKISKAQVLLVHERLLKQSGGSTGIRDEGLLESALTAPYQEFAGISNYPTIEEKRPDSDSASSKTSLHRRQQTHRSAYFSHHYQKRDSFLSDKV